MKINMCHYFGGSREDPKGGPEGSPQGPKPPLPPPPRARREGPWGPSPTSGAPLWPILAPRGENPKKGGDTEFCRRLVEETYREGNAISGGQIPPGRTPPGRGDHLHCHVHHQD